MFLKAAALRNEMLEANFTDNGGAIHSAERILNILGMALKYPGLTHINNYKDYENAEFSEKACRANQKGEKVLIEHVSPIRDFTRRAIELVSTKSIDEAGRALATFIEKHYRLVLLTPDETKKLNRENRSKMTSNRLAEITIVRQSSQCRRGRGAG
jgi:hypothetical protein